MWSLKSSLIILCLSKQIKLNHHDLDIFLWQYFILVCVSFATDHQVSAVFIIKSGINVVSLLQNGAHLIKRSSANPPCYLLLYLD